LNTQEALKRAENPNPPTQDPQTQNPTNPQTQTPRNSKALKETPKHSMLNSFKFAFSLPIGCTLCIIVDGALQVLNLPLTPYLLRGTHNLCLYCLRSPSYGWEEVISTVLPGFVPFGTNPEPFEWTEGEEAVLGALPITTGC